MGKNLTQAERLTCYDLLRQLNDRNPNFFKMTHVDYDALRIAIAKTGITVSLSNGMIRNMINVCGIDLPNLKSHSPLGVVATKVNTLVEQVDLLEKRLAKVEKDLF